MTDYKTILEQIYKEVSSMENHGNVASYIPELARVNPDNFGISLITTSKDSYQVGNAEDKFSIQSISKVLSLSVAISLVGDAIWDRIGVEPSGNSFNSIMQLEYERGKPRNPFINAGALVVADILISELENPKRYFLEFVKALSGDASLSYNGAVAASEKNFGYRNAALVNMMKSYGNIKNDVENVLDFYFHQCALEMSCKSLAAAFLAYANTGTPFSYLNTSLTKSQIKRVNALMLSCGFYDESGEFAFEVGLPGKSGVGGGIVAVHPNCFSVAVWSPRINAKGNSVFGMNALELLTTKTGSSIF